MKKITIEFEVDNSFDEDEFMMTIKGKAAYLALYEFNEVLFKLNNADEEFHEETLDKLISKFREILEENDINLSLIR
jgi:hypothetical protein